MHWFLLIMFIFCRAFSGELRFHQTHETLDTIVKIIEAKQKGAYLRFGDGDVCLAYGENDSYQIAEQLLQKEMREAFALNGSTILKTLPLYCREMNGWEEGMFLGNHEGSYSWCLDILKRAEMLWDTEISDVYSHAALAFAATKYPEKAISFLAFLRKKPNILLVANQNIPSSVREALFGKSCGFIPTPPSHSYREIDRIETQCIDYLSQHPGYTIVVTAMGCSGRALQKRLWHRSEDVFLFDFGSLMDALSGWNSRAWIALTHFDAGRFLSEFGSQ